MDDKEIGRGEFASLFRVIDARDGQVYPAKKFKPPLWTQNDNKKRKLEQEDWLMGIQNEYTIMKNNPHVSPVSLFHDPGLIVQKSNIIQVISFQEKPKPFVVMEYCYLGSLEDLQDVEPEQYVNASLQMLVGLRHLHNNRVAHRDLKPGNLLVVNRHPIHIKISDFGLSKVVAVDSVLRTFCGTPLYTAPEVYPKNRTGYRPSVDIWSAGVMIFKFIFGLPSYDANSQLPLTEWIEQWTDILLGRIDDLDENDDQVIDIIKHMVTIRPEDRFTAEQCLHKGCDNGLFKQRSDGQIIDADAPSKDDTTEVAAEINTEIAVLNTETSDDSGLDTSAATPRRSSSHKIQNGISSASIGPTILIGGLWGDEERCGQESSDIPSNQSTLIRGCNSGTPTRRRRTSHTSSWSLTIGLENSDSDGGFDVEKGDSGEVATGLFIKKDYFTANLESQFASEDEESGVRQGPLTSPEPAELTSFETRVLQALQA